MYMYYIIASLIGKFSFWIIILGAVGMMQRRQRGEPPEWRKRALTKDQQILVNMQYRAYREEIYKNYPQIDRFERNKKIWAGCLAFLCFLEMVLSFSRAPATSLSIVVGIVMCLFGYFIIYGAFMAVMGPKWKYAFALYVIGLAQIISFWRMMGGSWFMILGFLKYNLTDIRYTPLQTGSLCMPLINGVITLLTGVWLTAFKCSRELAQQSDALNTQINNDFTPTGI